MQYDIVIDNLNSQSEYVYVIAEWLYTEWGNHNLNYWKSWVEHSTQDDDIPKTYALFVNGKIAGTYSLWRCDLQSRQDLFPWFGGLYVDVPYRGKIYNNRKLGEILQEHAISELKKLHYKKVYLFTSKSTKYYIRNGWINMCKAPDENDQIVNICYKII